MVYFKPGVHDLGSNPVYPWNGQRAFPAGGAYVKGMFKIDKDAEDVAIEGLGSCRAPSARMSRRRSATDLSDDDRRVTRPREGDGRRITIVDLPFYNVKLDGPGHFVSNIKVISWMPNTDGITPGATALSSYSFFKTGDDAIKLYSSYRRVSGCILWQLGNAAPSRWGST